MLNEQTKTFSVSYRSLGKIRIAPQQDVLENRWLHQLFLLTLKPAEWTVWQLAGSLLVVAALIWLGWWPVGFATLTAAGIYLIFALADWLLLWWLPRAGRSFGPIGPQLLVMTMPRLGVAVASAVMALVMGPTAGLMVLVLLQLFGLLLYWWGMVKEPFALSTTHQTIQSPHLPAAAPPIRLLHLSDFHVERLTRRENQVLELVEALQPDIIVITGDYLNLSYVNEPTARAEARKVLEKLHAPYGVYATLGSPPVDPRDTTPSLFDGLNIRLLRDEVAVINVDDGRTLSLLGMDCEHDLDLDADAFKKLVDLAPPDSLRVLLYHSPELMPVVQQYPVDLYLCGHTHGGQIRLPFYGAIITSSALGKQYEMGPYLENGTTLYISRGIGLEGLSAPRMRLLCPPEIILFNLTGIGNGHQY
ncbi:MAG: metallophosphoesterase [Anaerolineae bacterium]|nr:metallophosphoesterase [Anaerolineae bacterium]